MRVKVVGGSVCLEREREIEIVCREREGVCCEIERVCVAIERGSVRGERKRGRDRVCAE